MGECKKVKKNQKILAILRKIVYTFQKQKIMQYKIPIQIENEDTIVLGLSLRQLGIMMAFGGIAYALFQFLESRIGGIALVPAIIVAGMGIGIALVRIAEMTFLPLTLNFLRMSLNGKARPWSQWTDSYTELEIGHISSSNEKIVQTTSKESFTSSIANNEDFAEKLKNL